jgi:glycosyltransferase involved in cell wall biosynthesis
MSGNHNSSFEPGVVSVVIPLKNAARYLPRALDSLRAQAVNRMEVVIVDGGSTDGTLDLVHAFRPDRLIHQDHPGIWAAFNAGRAAARGEFIAFLGGDDYWPLASLRHRLTVFESQPEVGCVFGLVQLFLEPGHVPPPGFRTELLAEPHPIRLLEAMVARQSVFAQVGEFREALAFGADTDCLQTDPF